MKELRFEHKEIIDIFSNITDKKYSRIVVEEEIEKMIEDLCNHKHELSSPISSRDLQLLYNIINILVQKLTLEKIENKRIREKK